jgi:serine/threonine protein kinase
VVINLRKEPILVDFGLALHAHQDERVTELGEPIGTPAYMPPEQVKGDVQTMGPGCDIYSLGVILYELLTGRLPYEGEPMTILAQIVTQEPPPPSAHRPDVDPQLEAICRKAMAHRVQDRYASMREFAEDLAAYRREYRKRAAAPGKPDGKSRWWAPWTWFLLGLASVAPGPGWPAEQGHPCSMYPAPCVCRSACDNHARPSLLCVL